MSFVLSIRCLNKLYEQHYATFSKFKVGNTEHRTFPKLLYLPFFLTNDNLNTREKVLEHRKRLTQSYSYNAIRELSMYCSMIIPMSAVLDKFVEICVLLWEKCLSGKWEMFYQWNCCIVAYVRSSKLRETRHTLWKFPDDLGLILAWFPRLKCCWDIGCLYAKWNWILLEFRFKCVFLNAL